MSEKEAAEESESVAEQDDEEAADDRDVIDPSEFPTLELTLEEAQRQYDDEETRRDTIENKIGIVVTVDTLLISFGALFDQGLHPILLIGILLPALVSAGLGLHAIRSRDYERPGKNIWDFYDYSEYDGMDSQREQLLLDYVRATGENKKKNDPKFSIFNNCIKLTFASLALLLVTPVAIELGILDALYQIAVHIFHEI